jgi:two-component system, cell cycle sensor histidine kinase and response regulator CckA
MKMPFHALFTKLETIVGALDEPAAVTSRSGRLLAANPAWIGQFGQANAVSVATQQLDDDAVFRLTKAARRGMSAAEAMASSRLSTSPLGPKTLWRVHANLTSPPSGQVAVLPTIPTKPMTTLSGLEGLIASAPIGIVRLSSNDLKTAQIYDVNNAFGRLATGTAPSASFADLLLPEDIDSLPRLIAGAEEAVSLRFKSGKAAEIWRIDDPENRAILICVDATGRREMESRMAQGSKMQAIGQIAGGVAHELNNLLTVVTLNADKLLALHPVGDPSYMELSQIQQTTGRAAELVKMLLAYARKQTFRRDVLDVGDVLSDIAVLLRQVVDEKIKIEITHGRDLPAVKADRQQLETVLMNLVTNARDAITSAGTQGARIMVSTKSVESPAVRSALRGAGITEVPDSKWAAVSVADNGSGIPSELVEKIFEPFFTTKEVGKGTGIGLATVYGIVKQSNGFIGLETKEGEGTSFTVFLPAHIPDANEIAAPAQNPQTATKPADLAGRGRILLVEDEDGVRSIAAQLLTQRGYSVTEACDGEEALEIIQDNPSGFDLMLSDVVMPGMDGPALLKAAGDLLGDARVVFMSGYAERDFAETLDANRSIAFLPKPFTLQQLAERVKTELTGG